MPEKFKVGDRVVATGHEDNIRPIGEGTVVSVGFKMVGVDWDGPIEQYHDCGGIARDNHGWYMSEDKLMHTSHHVGELTTKQPIMQKLNSMLKRILDSESQTLYKAGYLNGDLELTNRGRDALNAILFTENKAKLVAAAQADLDEEKNAN